LFEDRTRLVTIVGVVVIDGLNGIDGRRIDPTVLDGKAILVVNVASRCGLTPQYEGLERLQERYGAAGFTVLGVPCNQFAGQEPGTPEEIQEFCSTTYGTSFPLTEKLQVNGHHQHPLYRQLTAVPDGDGQAGEIQWNFEKFLISPTGEIVARFRPGVEPEDDQVTHAIERVLP
jgi:glutathione peroxidase